ncbi:MAG: hypothetical protein AAGB93_12150 [Planctomycetota bacterium]
MSYVSWHVPEHDIVVQRWSDPVELEAALAAKREEMARVEYGDGTVWLADARGTEVDVDFVKAWAPAIAAEFPDHLHRLAILVDGPRLTALGMMLAKAHEGRHKRTEVFSTLDGAITWLGLDSSKCTSAALGLDASNRGDRANRGA